MKASFVLLAALLAAGVARADDPARGFYLGASAGSATVELEDADSYYDFDGDDTGYKLVAGYRFIPWFGLEASYADYGQARDRVYGIPLQSDFHATSLEAIGMLPIGNVDLFLKGGVASWKGTLEAVDYYGTSVTEDHVDPMGGLGVQLRFGRLAVRGEVQAIMLRIDDDGDDEADGDDWVRFASVGIAWTF